RPQRRRPLDLRPRHGAEHVAADRSDNGHHHDAQDNPAAEQVAARQWDRADDLPAAADRPLPEEPLESRYVAESRFEVRLPLLLEERRQDKQPPQPERDARDRGQEFDKKRHGRDEPPRGYADEEQCRPKTEWHREEKCKR